MVQRPESALFDKLWAPQAARELAEWRAQGTTMVATIEGPVAVAQEVTIEAEADSTL